MADASTIEAMLRDYREMNELREKLQAAEARVSKLERAMKERDADNIALNAEVEAAETALAAANERVKELERQLQHAADDSEKNFEGWRQADTELKGTTESLEAAKTALLKAEETLKSQALELASARAFLERLRDTPAARRNAWLQALRSEVTTWLTSRPAPVAAHCAGCAAASKLLQTANEAPTLDGWWERRDAWLTSHPAPVAAPEEEL